MRNRYFEDLEEDIVRKARLDRITREALHETKQEILQMIYCDLGYELKEEEEE